jgi:hypothetical protein
VRAQAELGHEIRAYASTLADLVFTEVKLLRAFLPERISCKLTAAFGAKVVTEVLKGRFRESGVGHTLLHVMQKLADRFHVVLVKVRFGDLGGVVGGENFNLDYIPTVVIRLKILATEITRDV